MFGGFGVLVLHYFAGGLLCLGFLTSDGFADGFVWFYVGLCLVVLAGI